MLCQDGGFHPSNGDWLGMEQGGRFLPFHFSVHLSQALCWIGDMACHGSQATALMHQASPYALYSHYGSFGSFFQNPSASRSDMHT